MVNVPVVKLGSDDAKLPGSPVCNVQRLLAAHGNPGMVIDGQAGPKTIAALKHFQQIYGQKVTGQTDGPTLATLMRA